MSGHLHQVHYDGDDWDLLRSADGTYDWCRAHRGDVTDHNRGLTLDEFREDMADFFPEEVERQFLLFLDTRGES